MPKNLLLADDSKTIQQAVSMTFAREDVKLTTVEDGEAALKAARASRPDLILADVSMPRLGGYDLCQKVRADASLKDIPVLLLGGGTPIDPAKAMAVGANGHMPKPFDSGKLIEQVKQILANPRLAGASMAAPRPTASPTAPPRPGAPQVTSRPPPPGAPPAYPGAAGGTMLMSRPPPQGVPKPGVSTPPGLRPQPPGAARPAVPGAPAARPSMPPGARPPLTASPAGAPRPAAPPAARPPPGAPPTRSSMPPVAPAGARPPAPGQKLPPPTSRPPAPAMRPPPPPIEVDEDIPMDEDDGVEEVAKAPTQLRPVPTSPAPKPSLSVVPQPPARHPPAGADGGETVLREALSKASREVIEKIAWEVVPELAETIIREELERLIKERGA